MSQPELLKFALSRQIRRLGCKGKLDGGRALASWAEVVGPQIARHARAESLSGGTLTVVVPDAAWRQELTFQKQDLIKRLNAALECDVVRELFLVATSRKTDG